MGANKARAQLYVSHEDLQLIDQAAKMAGQSRSAYMVRACLDRMGMTTEFTPTQHEEIRSVVLDVIAEVTRIDWILKVKDDD